MPTTRPAAGADRAAPPTDVLHVGDDPASPAGGISRVIRDHLERCLADVRPHAVPSYDPVGTNTLHRQRPAARAALTLLRRPSRRRRTTIVHVHLADRGSLAREGGLAALARLLGYRVVVTWHSSAGLGETSATRRGMLRLAVACAHRFTVLSEAHMLALPTRKNVVVVPNDVGDPARPHPMTERRPVVVFAGDVGWRKGADTLLRAWARTARGRWSLEVFGRVEEAFEEELRERGDLAGVTLHGLVTPDVVTSSLRTASVAVLPSRAEALPMFLLEAMASGCAVIGSTAGGIPELLADGAGIAVPPGDVEGLTTALDRLLGSPELRTQLQGAAVARIASRFSRSAGSERWSEMYREVLAAG